MQLNKVSASTRTASGKNVNRRLRAAGSIPAVTYGRGKTPVALSVNPEEVIAALKSDRGRNAVLEVELDGSSKFTAMIREYQYHPVTRELLHADLIEVDEGSEVEVRVPLILTGKAKGIVMGGVLQQVYREVPVRCVPSKIPVKIEHDITGVDVEGHVQAKDLGLPEGVSVALPPKQTLAHIQATRATKEDDEAAPAAAGAGAKAGAAKPAAAKPAAKK